MTAGYFGYALSDSETVQRPTLLFTESREH